MKQLMNIYDDLHWENADDYYEGTLRKVIRQEDGRRTVLLKLPAGFSMSPHSHIVAEQHFVIEGEYLSNGKLFPAGSYQIFSPGDEHGPFQSEKGALILVIWDPIKVSE